MPAVWTVWLDGERAGGTAGCGCEADGLAVYFVCREGKVRVVDVEPEALSRYGGRDPGVCGCSWYMHMVGSRHDLAYVALAPHLMKTVVQQTHSLRNRK